MGKKRDIKSEFVARLTSEGSRVEQFISSQIVFASGHFRQPLDDIWEDEFTRLYAFGAFDSLLVELPIEARKRVAPAIIELGFVQWAMRQFSVPEAEAKLAIEAVFRLQAKNPTHPAIMKAESMAWK